MCTCTFVHISRLDLVVLSGTIWKPNAFHYFNLFCENYGCYLPATIVTNKTVRRQKGFIMTSSVCHQGITIIGETQPQVIHSKYKDSLTENWLYDTGKVEGCDVQY